MPDDTKNECAKSCILTMTVTLLHCAALRVTTPCTPKLRKKTESDRNLYLTLKVQVQQRW